MNGKFRKATFWILILGIVLRLALALGNRESNDDHVIVSRIMAYENRIPEMHEEPQAYHPKLYHGTVGALLKVVPRDMAQLHKTVGQLISWLAGVITLLVAYRFFMKEIEVSDKVGFITFSLLALNPALIGINGQATNDSFAILFSSLAFYFGWHFFQSQRTGDFCWMSVFSILAALSKVNGLIIFIAIVAVFGIALCRTGDRHLLMSRRTMAIYGLIFVASYLVLVSTLGPYGEHYRLYGTPLPNNAFYKSEGGLPFTLPSDSKPGETSVARALFTFPLSEMIKTPVLPINEGGHPQSPTSLWGELYARTHFVHYDAWPRSWQLPTRRLLWITSLTLDLGRGIFLIALLPTLLMLSGLLRNVFLSARAFISARLSDRPLSEWFLSVSAVGYILFMVALRLQFKDFGTMKAIYIFPGLFCFLLLFAGECERFFAWCDNKRILRRSVSGIFAVLFVFYVAEIAILVGQLGLSMASRLLYGA